MKIAPFSLIIVLLIVIPHFNYVRFLSGSSYEVITDWEITLRDDLVAVELLLIIISPSSSSLLFLRRFSTWTIIGAVCSLIDTDADFPQAGWTGSNATICCGIGWFGGKLSRYCRCLMYLIANLKEKIFSQLEKFNMKSSISYNERKV